MSSFIHSAVIAVVLTSKNKFYNCKANDLGVVWCSYNEQTKPLCVYRRLLTNHLHGKAAELCLANSWAHVHSIFIAFLSRGVGKVLL